MLRATLRGLLARKLRLALSGLAIVLSIAFVSGTYVLTDSLGRVFDNLFADVNEGTAVTVRGVSALGEEAGGDVDREPLPQTVLDRVRQVDGVAEALGHVGGFAQVLDNKGKAYQTGGAPSFGLDFTPSSLQQPLRIKAGKAPSSPTEVAVDATTARKAGLQVGDTVTVLLKGPAQDLTLVGTIGLKEADSFAGASLVAFEPSTAQRLLGTPGHWNEISVAAEPGTTTEALRTQVGAVLPGGVEAVSAEQAAEESTQDIKQFLGFFNTALLIFASVSVFVGGFLIFNAFTMLVAQRTRELALMRALGASRRQITTSVLLEAVVVGLLSSLVGFGLGVLVAKGLQNLLTAIGLTLPEGATVVATRTFVVSLLVGVGITVLAALIPARRAAKVSPVQAMRESGPAEDRSLRRRTIVGAVVLGLGIASLTGGLTGSGVPLVGLGAVLSFLGVATLSPLVARPVVGVLGLPFVAGASGRIGRGNAMRSPRRTSATAAALMVGLALVATVSTLGASIKKSVVKVVETSLGADYVLHAAQFQPFSPLVVEALAGKPGLDAVAGFRFGVAKVGSAGKVEVQGVNPAALAAVLKLDVSQGSLDALSQGRLAVSETEAENLRAKVGDTVDVTWSRTGQHPLRIGAVYADNEFAGGYLVSDATYDANVTEKLLGVVAIKASGPTSDSRAAIDAALKPFPNVEVEDRAEFVKAQGDQIDMLLNLITALLVLSVLIALLGVVNTVALSVVERTRELGLLRAVGMQRRQLRRMIRVESVVIALYGALLGVVVGLAFGRALVVALSDEGISEFALPLGRVLVVVLVAGLGGVLAAALPARRAARMDVLQAIATE